MRLSIQQPYFIPYAGFFRLLSSVDLFVIYDDVQFPYPGFVHRNKLTLENGEKEWLTIPLKTMPLATQIKDIRFAEDYRKRWQMSRKKFPVFETESGLPCVASTTFWTAPAHFILATMKEACAQLSIKTEAVTSSHTNIRPDLKGQDRVLAICEHLKATEYINAPGGTHLYDHDTFKKRGIELKFLTPFENKTSILERLAYEKAKDVRKEIDDNTRFQ